MAVGPSTFGDIGGGVSDIFSFMGTGYKEQALQFEQQNYQQAAQLALQNEQFTKTSTAIKQGQADQQLYTSLGRTKAGEAGAGLAQSGSAVDILRESAQQGATTNAAIGQQGLITEAGYQEQYNAYTNMASAAQSAEDATNLSGIGDLIGGGMKFAAAFATMA
jgi:hypothetical protein